MAKLNVQALARRSEELVGCIIPDQGNVIISIDLSAGEPTVTSEFSRDANYIDAIFNTQGKVPEYKNGILKISDLYLTVMSVSPVGKDKMKQAFEDKWPAGSFQDQWMQDPEVIKKALKSERNFHKMLCLGLGYGMGGKKMTKAAYEAGYELSLKDARQFHKIYWLLFNGIRSFADRLAEKMEKEGAIVNPFGYRYVCDPSKAYNYFCQSSVSGIMHVFGAKLFAQAPYAKYVTTIHDEDLIEVPENMIEQFRKDTQIATDSLNADLGWSIAIRTGFAIGRNWYEAK